MSPLVALRHLVTVTATVSVAVAVVKAVVVISSRFSKRRSTHQADIRLSRKFILY